MNPRSLFVYNSHNILVILGTVPYTAVKAVLWLCIMTIVNKKEQMKHVTVAKLSQLNTDNFINLWQIYNNTRILTSFFHG